MLVVAMAEATAVAPEEAAMAASRRVAGVAAAPTSPTVGSFHSDSVNLRRFPSSAAAAPDSIGGGVR